MIVWIDEDERNNFPQQLLLRGEGFKLELIPNATEGLSRVVNIGFHALTLMIVDVMLLQGTDTVVFSDSATEKGLKTGLILVDALLTEMPDFNWTSKILLYSSANDNRLVRAIEAFAKTKGLPYRRKSEDMMAEQFISWLKSQKLIPNGA